MSTYTGRAGAGVGGGRVLAFAREWTVGNFKSLDHVSLPLTHLNVLTGANSSGKSSVIQSLLMLAQSTDDEIILNGPLVRLGEPRDVIRSGMNELTLAYSARHRFRGEESRSEWSFEISLAPEGSTLRVVEFFAAVDGEPILAATAKRVAAATRQEINSDDRYGDAILRVREIQGRQAPPRTYLSFRGFYPEALLVRRTRQQVLASMRRNYSQKAIRENPDRAFQLYEEVQSWWRSREGRKSAPPQIIADLERILRQDASPARILFELNRAELDLVFQAVAELSETDDWVPVPVSRYVPPMYSRSFGFRANALGIPAEHGDVLRGLAAANDALRAIRESIRYLGPLREEPQVVSATGGRNRSVPAGPKGEYTADLLARNKNDQVEFKDWDRKTHREKLPDAVSVWTTYLGVGDMVAVEDQGKLGRGLRIRVNGVERDLTTVGVGASQVLPVLTVVLAATRGSIVLLEQPELHLHPAVQSRLADFFLWARPDITIVVETHSEYLISRLRRRAAEGSADAKAISIMFAEQSGGVTAIRPLKMNALGDLSDWPAGFFDTQDEEARALVKAVQRGVRGERKQ